MVPVYYSQSFLATWLRWYWPKSHTCPQLESEALDCGSASPATEVAVLATEAGLLDCTRCHIVVFAAAVRSDSLGSMCSLANALASGLIT